jgi:hypothetical protein
MNNDDSITSPLLMPQTVIPTVDFSLSHTVTNDSPCRVYAKVKCRSVPKQAPSHGEHTSCRRRVAKATVAKAPSLLPKAMYEIWPWTRKSSVLLRLRRVKASHPVAMASSSVVVAQGNNNA